MKEEKEQEEKLKALEKAQKEGIEKQKELAKEANRKEEEEKTSIHDPEFVIRESKQGAQEHKRMFLPDFDESEVPPLE